MNNPSAQKREQNQSFGKQCLEKQRGGTTGVFGTGPKGDHEGGRKPDAVGDEGRQHSKPGLKSKIAKGTRKVERSQRGVSGTKG